MLLALKLSLATLKGPEDLLTLWDLGIGRLVTALLKMDKKQAKIADNRKMTLLGLGFHSWAFWLIGSCGPLLGACLGLSHPAFGYQGLGICGLSSLWTQFQVPSWKEKWLRSPQSQNKHFCYNQTYETVCKREG